MQAQSQSGPSIFPQREKAISPPCFTVAELARPLGALPQSVRRFLSTIEADAAKIVQGQSTAAWYETTLPEKLRDSLDAARKRTGARSLRELVQMPPERWQPRDSQGR